MSKLTALIVDDENRAREVLKAILQKHFPNVEIVALVGDIPEAVKAIHKHKPQLIFLDVEMPGYSGLELMDFFEPEKIDFKIIFVTAYSEYALQAFRLSAIDYLLKPIQIEQLREAIQKAENSIATHQQQNENLKLSSLKDNYNSSNRKIALPLSDGILLLALNDIVYLKAEGSYTQLYLTDGSKLLISKKLADLEHLCESGEFFRTHRSYMVNISHIKKIGRYDADVLMDNGHEISITNEKRAILLEIVKEGK